MHTVDAQWKQWGFLSKVVGFSLNTCIWTYLGVFRAYLVFHAYFTRILRVFYAYFTVEVDLYQNTGVVKSIPQYFAVFSMYFINTSDTYWIHSNTLRIRSIPTYSLPPPRSLHRIRVTIAEYVRIRWNTLRIFLCTGSTSDKDHHQGRQVLGAGGQSCGQ